MMWPISQIWAGQPETSRRVRATLQNPGKFTATPQPRINTSPKLEIQGVDVLENIYIHARRENAMENSMTRHPVKVKLVSDQ